MNNKKVLYLLGLIVFSSTAIASPPLDYCRDLMVQVRNTYGKAPFCVPVKDNSGNEITEYSNLVGLSDDLDPKHAYFFMNIVPGQLDGHYSYNENELNQLIALIRMQNKGVTKSEGGIINLEDGINNLNALLKNGTITKKFHDEAVSNLEKGIKDLQK
ncbi:Uncharacterised protein [Serratia quinivorans]|uniref:hypothetical protein n=1 Tax=Serratia quinivorans TaxID=137545 RepID=UPI0021798CD3|nr:hypothetical protein [Serratia quinivorans]CAI1524057.1 Uncharacterised protein [Serratia quinivorans]